MFRRLFKSVSQFDERRFAPRAFGEGDAYGQAECEACGYGDVRVARYRRSRRKAAGEMVAVGVIGRPRGAARRRNQRI